MFNNRGDNKVMAIYLDNQLRVYLERKFKDVADTDFIGKRVQTALRADRERIESIEACNHQKGDYTGTKTCCVKCGSLFEKGMSESWDLKNEN